MMPLDNNSLTQAHPQTSDIPEYVFTDPSVIPTINYYFISSIYSMSQTEKVLISACDHYLKTSSLDQFYWKHSYMQPDSSKDGLLFISKSYWLLIGLIRGTLLVDDEDKIGQKNRVENTTIRHCYPWGNADESSNSRGEGWPGQVNSRKSFKTL